MISIELRDRIVASYLTGLTGSYEKTASVFGVGRATVSRLLRRYRERGHVQPDPMGGNNPRKVDLVWLERHANAYPDARLWERIEAWEQKSGTQVCSATMSSAMRSIGWTHKKRHR